MGVHLRWGPNNGEFESALHVQQEMQILRHDDGRPSTTRVRPRKGFEFSGGKNPPPARSASTKRHDVDNR